MQQRHEAIIRSINNNGRDRNVLTFPTHERYQSNLGNLPYNFYMWCGQGIKGWTTKYAQMPDNHVLLNGSDDQVKNDMKFDIILSQNKYGQFQVAKESADRLNIPLISLEHCLPDPRWPVSQIQQLSSMRGDINVFISEFSAKKWGCDLSDPTVRILHHGVDTDLFKPDESIEKNGKINTTANDYINRDVLLGWGIYKRVCLDNQLPIFPVGDTPGFSKSAKNTDELVKFYNSSSCFLNTSIVSPIPTALLEAMSCGLACVSTSTCMIPEIITDGVNGFISNDESYLLEKLKWCLNNPEEAKEIGKNARKTILERFSLTKHLQKWKDLLDEAYGSCHY